MRYLLAIILLFSCLACEGGIPISAVEGPLVPTATQIPAELHLPEGRLSGQVSGPNIPITEENIKVAAEKVFTLLHTNMRKALTRDTVTGTFNNLFELWDVGDAKLSGTFKAEIDDQGHYKFKGDFTAELNDWTVDGEQFIGGGLAYDIAYYINTRATDSFGCTGKVSGIIDLGGKYRGSISFREFHVQWGAWIDRYEGEFLILSNGLQLSHYLNKYCEKGDCQWIEH